MKSDRIKEAFYELKDTLIGAKIDGVRQLDDYSFIFSMFGSGKKLSLLISVLKRLRRFHFLFEKVHKEYLFSSNAVSVFKKYLLKGRIRRAVMYEQCVELSIEHVGKYTLILDFLSCNIALFDEGNNVLFALHRRDIRKPEESGPVTASIKNKGTGFFDFPLNEELSADFFNERKESLERAMFRIIKAEEKKVLRLSEKLYAEKKDIKSKENYKKIGELLKYNLSRVPRGAETAMLNDFDGQEVTVNLNPRLSLLENMTFYFNKYKKLKKKEGRIDEKIQNQDKKLDLITDLKREIEAGNLSLTRSPAL
ncbi:MAG: NFACT family protein, partial [Spirochaetes bacterium]|nr:NFACT family protein [Spirochaetota bacterium]